MYVQSDHLQLNRQRIVLDRGQMCEYTHSKSTLYILCYNVFYYLPVFVDAKQIFVCKIRGQKEYYLKKIKTLEIYIPLQKDEIRASINLLGTSLAKHVEPCEPGKTGKTAVDILNSIPEEKNGLSVVLIHTTLWPEL